MNEDILKGKWTQLKGYLREKWGELTDDELDQIQGEREQLIGKLQEKYGWEREKAEREVDDYLNEISRRIGL